ncbi:MAG: DUF6882 domain-containing protein [Chitinophagaceae bacterium]
MSLFSFFRNNKKQAKNCLYDLPGLDTISFDELSQKAYTYLNNQQAIFQKTYNIDWSEDWFYDQLTGELTFSKNEIKKLIIMYEEVGSVSFKSDTWLWAWDNPHLEEKIKSEITIVRDYGATRNFEKLIIPKWEADEYDGWEMTAISAYLMQAKGAYRAPSSDGSLYSFMIFKEIRWADGVNPN